MRIYTMFILDALLCTCVDEKHEPLFVMMASETAGLFMYTIQFSAC